MILSFLLIGLTLLVAGYALRTACIGSTPHKDSRPLFMTFFLLLSLAVLEVTLALSPEVSILSRYFVTLWVSIETLLIGCVGWLVILLNTTAQDSFNTKER